MNTRRHGFALSGWLLLVAALAGCPFDPKVPSARVLCAQTADCPAGYTCEPVAGARQPGLAVCCQAAGCAQNLPDAAVQQLEKVRKDAAAADRPSDASPMANQDGAGEAGSDARADLPRDAASDPVSDAGSDAGQRTCGNGRLDPGETCDPISSCPTSCPAIGCMKRKLSGSADSCTATCVPDTTITVCASGDSCCASGCTTANDSDCNCQCGNGLTEVACNESCDGANCPSACPPVGCQLRALQGTAQLCTAKCVNTTSISACANGDSCCPTGCSANNDSDCTPTCGNGVVESGETCDPPSACQAQSDACVSDNDNLRARSGAVASCTFACAATPRGCSAGLDGFCPTACTPCGDICTSGQDLDCKYGNGTGCTSVNQCGTGNCVDGVCCDTPCAGACDSCSTGTCTVTALGGAGSPGCGNYVCNGSSASCPTSCAGSEVCSAGNVCLNSVCACQPSCPTNCRTSAVSNGCGGTCPRNCTGCCNSLIECRTGLACD